MTTNDAPIIDPSLASSCHAEMEAHWCLIRDIFGGEPAIKRGKTKYLPRYEAETDVSYAYRLQSTPWRGEFVDAVRNLSAKPFSKPVALQGEVPDEIKIFSEDVTGSGVNLHEFARDLFGTAVGYGLGVIIVDYPKTQKGLTLADEKKIGARPYFVKIAPENVLAAYFENRGGRLVLTHLRIKECTIVRDGYSEREVKTIRIYEPGSYEVWSDEGGTFQLTDSGSTSLNEIPAVFYFTGSRFGEYGVRPPLLDLAYMQIELFRSLSRWDEILTYAGSPMLKVLGADTNQLDSEQGSGGKKEPVAPVGPKRIWFIPKGSDGQQGDIAYIQPDAKNLEEIRNQVGKVQEDFRRLAMQPLLPQTGNITATSSAIEGAKAHSAVQAWAMGLQDCLEQALVYAARWMGVPETAEVYVNTDFVADFRPADDVKDLNAMQMAGSLSRRTLWDELQRRGTLGPQFDPDMEEERIGEEGGGLGALMHNHSHDTGSDGSDVPTDTGAVLGEAA